MLSDAQRAALKSVLGKSIEFDVPLAPKTSMKVGGPAAAYAEIGGVVNLTAALSQCEQLSVPWSIIGFGSNLLVPDEGYPGLVVRLVGDFTKVTIKGTKVRAGAATPIVSLCREAALAGLAGAEGLVGIPGTIGGAVRMNAGTDVEIGDVIKRVEVLVAGEPLQTFTTPEFSYRRSSLDRRAVVTAAELELTPGDPATVQAELRKRIAKRNATQPLELPNSGSIFRNPPGDHAARLIDAAGCKGWHWGGAEVSDKHANFIVNRGGATCADVLALADRVRAAVKEKFGVELELEVHVLA
ncbi:MAG: UDP-N-acetylmuramate dehydrogenase [Candidatus Eremiobacteraeota bacterium]|nr:UDP-N-acetylmuramate dehydrogenase [Candidatus Eremiobacteraeota bacterium]